MGVLCTCFFGGNDKYVDKSVGGRGGKMRWIRGRFLGSGQPGVTSGSKCQNGKCIHYVRFQIMIDCVMGLTDHGA